MPSAWQRPDRQQGWTFWSALFVASVVVFFAYIGMQLVPVYANNASVRNAMVQAMDESDLRRVTRSQIIRSLNQQLYLDETHRILDYKRDLKIGRSRSQFVMEINYQREIHLFHNMSLLVSFDNREERALQ